MGIQAKPMGVMKSDFRKMDKDANKRAAAKKEKDKDTKKK